MYRAFLVKSAASAVAAPRAIEKAFLKCAWAVVALACFNGCVGEQRQVISGTVSVGGVKADTGRLFFVPVEGAKGPRIIAEITDGAYRIESDGGLLAGKYRVELDAQKRTGRKTKGRIMGGETVERDETIPMAPRLYRDADSPLIVEIPAADDGVVNIEVPAA